MVALSRGTTAGAAGPPSSTGSTHREKGPDCQLTNKMWQFTQLPSRFAKGPTSMRTELAHLRAASHLVQRDYRRAESAICASLQEASELAAPGWTGIALSS